MVYIVAFYEIELVYGGPEEGGWWYERGDRVRILRRRPASEDEAARLAQRANRLLERLQRRLPPVSSVIYRGGRFAACVYEDAAPVHYPTQRPHYE